MCTAGLPVVNATATLRVHQINRGRQGVELKPLLVAQFQILLLKLSKKTTKCYSIIKN